MAKTDSNIGSLKRTTYLAGDSLLVAEQQGEAFAVEGALFIEFAQQAVEPQVVEAQRAAESAATHENGAEASKKAAAASAQRIEDMGVSAATIDYDKEATVTKESGEDAVKLVFGIPGGKSAYQYAVDAGYTGTEKEFGELLRANSGVSYVADGGRPGSIDTLVFDGGTPFTTDELYLDGGAV